RFDVQRSALPDDVKQRLTRLAGHHMTDEGVLILNARQFRTQERNRQEAIRRLVAMIRAACERPKARHKTRPTLASKQRRTESKRRHSETKRQRRSTPGTEY